MKEFYTYQNPVIRGFAPDPSICKAGDTYFLVCSSFQYFPGLPIFESKDLINWKRIGHALTRASQLPLASAESAGGLYAPTIRYHKGRFYIVCTNCSGGGNFLVWTDDIYGKWSEPVIINRDGIDPSLFFEDDKVYFMSNHNDEDGMASIMQCQIDPLTGASLTEARAIWRGTGGRYLEGPHLYHIKDYYYLMAAEGGTEYGHMEVIARSRAPYGPFETPDSSHLAANPIVTNRNLGGYQLQGTGHGDLICDEKGHYWMVLLAFRQLDRYLPFHHLGREVCLIPVNFTKDGWLLCGDRGTVRLDMTVDSNRPLPKQHFVNKYSFENTSLGLDWVFLRNPFDQNYHMDSTSLTLYGTKATLDEKHISPTFVGLRQQELSGHVTVNLASSSQEAGITLYYDSDHHYDLAVTEISGTKHIIKRRTAGDMQFIQEDISLPAATSSITLNIDMAALAYTFKAITSSQSFDLGTADTRPLSSECACGFTGVMIGLYAVDGEATFSEFSYTL